MLKQNIVQHLFLTAGTEMCLEVVRTRAFAALLSDEVFADVDLEALQVGSEPVLGEVIGSISVVVVVARPC